MQTVFFTFLSFKKQNFPKKEIYFILSFKIFFFKIRVSKNQKANFRHSMWKLLIFHKFRNSKNQQMIHKGRLERQELLIWTNLLHKMSEYQLMFYENKDIYRMNSSHFFLSIFTLPSSSVSLFLLFSFLCWITTGFCKCYCKIMVNKEYGYLLCNFVYTNSDKIEISLYIYVHNKWKAIKNVKYELVLNYKWHFENVCKILIWTIER